MEAVTTIEAEAGITISQANGEPPVLVEGVSIQTDRVEFLESSANGDGQLMHGEDNPQEANVHAGAGEALKGRQLRKKFGRKFFRGTVVDFEPDTNWYKVHYEDGDSEELEWAELEPLLVSDEAPPKSNKRPGAVAAPKSGKKSRKTKQLERLNQEALLTGQIDLNEALQDVSQNGVSVEFEDKDMQEEQAPDGEVVEAEENEGDIRNHENIVIETADNINGEADQDVVDPDEKKSRAGRRKTGNSKKVRKPTAKSRTPKVQKIEESEEPPKEVKAEPKSKSPRKKSSAPPETEVSSTPRKSKRKMEVITPASKVLSPAVKKKRKSEDGAPRARKASRKAIGSPAKSPKGKRIQKTPSEETKEQDDAEQHGSKFSLLDRGVKLVGRKLRKDFDGAMYNGEITGYNRRTRYYKIQYEDGDEEEMEWRELEPLLVPLEEELSSSSAEAGTSRQSLVKTTVKVVTTVKKSTVVKQRPLTRSSQTTRRMRRSATSVS